MKRPKKVTYRLEVYWEARGGLAEGGMEDPRYFDLKRKPTRHDMDSIERALREVVQDLGLYEKG